MFCQYLQDLSIRLLNGGEVITLCVDDSRKIVEGDCYRTLLRPSLRCGDKQKSKDDETCRNSLQGNPSLDVIGFDVKSSRTPQVSKRRRFATAFPAMSVWDISA